MATAAEIIAHESYIFNLPTHDRIVELNRYVPTLTEAEKAIFYQTNASHAAALTAQYDRERAEAREAHEWETWTGVAGFGLAGAALTPVISSVFGAPAAGYVAGAGGDIAALAMEPAAAASFVLKEPSLLDKIWTAGKDLGGVVTAALGYGKGVQQILSPIFETLYPTVADSTGAAEYTKLADQGNVTGLTIPGVPGVPGETDSTLYIVGGIVLLFLLMRRVKR